MRIRSHRYLLVAIVTMILAGCSRPGNEFIGKWRNTKSASNQIEITRNGGNFLIRIKEPAVFGGNQQTTTVPGILKDGILQVQNGPFAGNLTYVHQTGRLTTPGLLGGNVEYERVK